MGTDTAGTVPGTETGNDQPIEPPGRCSQQLPIVPEDCGYTQGYTYRAG